MYPHPHPAGPGAVAIPLKQGLIFNCRRCPYWLERTPVAIPLKQGLIFNFHELENISNDQVAIPLKQGLIFNTPRYKPPNLKGRNPFEAGTNFQCARIDTPQAGNVAIPLKQGLIFNRQYSFPIPQSFVAIPLKQGLIFNLIFWGITLWKLCRNPFEAGTNFQSGFWLNLPRLPASQSLWSRD